MVLTRYWTNVCFHLLYLLKTLKISNKCAYFKPTYICQYFNSVLIPGNANYSQRSVVDFIKLRMETRKIFLQNDSFLLVTFKTNIIWMKSKRMIFCPQMSSHKWLIYALAVVCVSIRQAAAAPAPQEDSPPMPVRSYSSKIHDNNRNRDNN